VANGYVCRWKSGDVLFTGVGLLVLLYEADDDFWWRFGREFRAAER
jgi:hypothetical protein